MLIFDDIVFYIKNKMMSVVYSYMIFDIVVYGGVFGNRKFFVYC